MGNLFSYELLPLVLNMSVTASAVILLVLLARLLLRRAPKAYSYALWAVVLFRLLCPVSLTAPFSLLALLDAPVKETTAYTTAAEYIPRDIVHTPAPAVALPVPALEEAVNERLPQGEEQTTADPLEAPAALASLLWLAGMWGLAGYSGVSLLLLRRRLREAVPLAGNVYLADRVETPFVMGLFRPKIYLPSSLPEGERGYILLHERRHIRRGDPIWKLLAFLALCVHWFNPLVWLAFLLSSRDMEMSCDEAVVGQLGEEVRKDYSASLLRLATGRPILSGTPLAFGEGDTGSRIRNLLRWKRPRRWVSALAVLLCIAVLAACGGNPGQDREAAEINQRYASMEDYVAREMAAETTITVQVWEEPFQTLAEDRAEVPVLEHKLDSLELLGSLEGMDPAGVLEAWRYSWLVKPDESAIDPASIVVAGGMYQDEEGFFCLENATLAIALRDAGGTCEILDTQPWGDGMDFYGCHNSCQEALYDWYVQKLGLDLPLYAEDWIDLITVPEGGSLGNYPVHRYDGEGWYLYIPVSAWEPEAAAFPEHHWAWTSGYGTGSTLTVDRFTQSPEDEYTVSRKQGFVPAEGEEGVWERHQDGVHETYRFYTAPDGGTFRVWTYWTEEGVTDYPYIAMEPEVLSLMAASFTADPNWKGAAESSPAEQPGTALTEEELAWFNEWLEPMVYEKEGAVMGVNPRSCFLTSTYDQVTELDFEEFLRYFPGDGSEAGEEEFAALREVEAWPFREVETLEEMMVPVHKYPRRLVELVLGEYGGISTADLDTGAVAYLPEYDAYYNYTSDFGPGMFVCVRGEREGELVRLYGEGEARLLTLRQVGEGMYQFVSCQMLSEA